MTIEKLTAATDASGALERNRVIEAAERAKSVTGDGKGGA